MATKLKMPEEAREFFRKQGARGGRKGGRALMDKLTPEQRTELAKKAAAASAKVRTAKAEAKKAGGAKK